MKFLEGKYTMLGYTRAWRGVITSLWHNNCFDHFTLPYFPQDKFQYFYHLLSEWKYLKYIPFFFFLKTISMKSGLCFFQVLICLYFQSLFSMSLYYFPLALLIVLYFSCCSATYEIPLLCSLTCSSSSLILLGIEFITLLSLC